MQTSVRLKDSRKCETAKTECSAAMNSAMATGIPPLDHHSVIKGCITFELGDMIVPVASQNKFCDLPK